MTIPQITTDRPIKSPEVNVVLRDGQIVHGKVTKIHPNNKAEIQMGTTRVVAEIATPISVGQNYIFQVQQKGEQLVHLKVLGSHLTDNGPQNLAQLLQQLNIKVNRVNVQFTQSLIDEKIPFSRQQLAQALQLIEQTGANKETIELIKGMVANKLPLTDAYLQAINAVRNQSVSTVLNNVLSEMLQSPTQTDATKNLQILLQNMLQRPSITEQLNQLPMQQQTNLVQGLQLLKYVSSATAELGATNLHQVPQTAGNLASVITNVESQLLQLANNEVARTDFLQLIRESGPIRSLTASMMQSFPALASANLSQENFILLKERLTADLLPKLPTEIQTIMRSLLQLNNSENQKNIHTLLQTFSSNTLYSALLETVEQQANLNQQADAITREPILQARFLQHVQQFIQSSGITNEADFKALLSQAPEQLQELLIQQSGTLKSLLLSTIQEDTRSIEQLQQMVHFLNGMQLQAKESNNMMQVFLQIPGEKIGLLKDLSIEFEGRKTEDGKIDTDFCRILFVLYLKNVKETVIDMNVQKRVVSLTIYNEYSDQLEQNMGPLKNLMQENLEGLNFHLSNVRWKQLTDKENEDVTERAVEQKMPSKQEGFDFLV